MVDGPVEVMLMEAIHARLTSHLPAQGFCATDGTPWPCVDARWTLYEAHVAPQVFTDWLADRPAPAEHCCSGYPHGDEVVSEAPDKPASPHDRIETIAWPGPDTAAALREKQATIAALQAELEQVRREHAERLAVAHPPTPMFPHEARWGCCAYHQDLFERVQISYLKPEEKPMATTDDIHLPDGSCHPACHRHVAPLSQPSYPVMMGGVVAPPQPGSFEPQTTMNLRDRLDACSGILAHCHQILHEVGIYDPRQSAPVPAQPSGCFDQALDLMLGLEALRDRLADLQQRLGQL